MRYCDLETVCRPQAMPEDIEGLPARSEGPQWWVRINPLGSEHIKADLGLFASADFEGVVLPKAESGADVAQLAHRTGNLPVHAIVTETAASLFGMLSYRDPKSPLAAMSWARGVVAALARLQVCAKASSASFQLRARCASPARPPRVHRRRIFAIQGRQGLRAEAEAAGAKASPASSRSTRAVDHQFGLHASKNESLMARCSRLSRRTA